MRTRRVAGLAVLALGGVLLGLHAARYPPALPHADSAFQVGAVQAAKVVDMARTVGWLIVLNLAAWSLGGPLERALGPRADRSGFTVLYRIGLGFASLSVLVLGLAALHALEDRILYGSLLIFAAAAVLPLVRAWRRHPDGRRLRRDAWLVLAAVPFCLGAFLGAFTPDPGWDALTYHLAIPERYLFANAIVVTPFSHLGAYPFLMEMLFVPALFLAGPPLATLLHFEFGILLLGAVHVAARRISRTAGILAPTILLADPLFYRELSWAYNDLTLAFYALLAVVALEEWAASSGSSLPLRAGAFAGICILVKVQGVFVLAALLVVLWIFSEHRARIKLAASLSLVALTLLVCSPWMMRNLVFTGNPVAPLFQTVFQRAGAEFFDPTAIEQSTVFLSRIGMGRDLGALLMLPWNLVMRTVPGMYSNSFGYQVTPLYVLGVLAALFDPRIRREPFLRRLLVAGGVLTFLWFLTFQEARFLLPALGCFAVAGGSALAALMAGLPDWGRVVPALLVAGLLYCQALFVQELPARYGYALGGLSIEEFASREPVEKAAGALRDTMGPRDRLLLFGESRAFFFRGLDYIPYHINEGSQTLQWIHRQSDLDALRCALKTQGVTHVLVNREHLRMFPPVFLASYREEDFGRDLALVQEFLKGYTKSIFSEGGIWVGEVVDTPDCHS